MSRHSVRCTGLVFGFGIIVLIIGLTLAWLGGHDYLPLNPQLGVEVTLLLVCVIFCLSYTTLMAEASVTEEQNLSTIPKERKDDFTSRVIRNSISGEETLIQADANVSIREIFEDKWPFQKKVLSDWYIVDENGNDVTDWPISNWEGTAVIYFSDYLS